MLTQRACSFNKDLLKDATLLHNLDLMDNFYHFALLNQTQIPANLNKVVTLQLF